MGTKLNRRSEDDEVSHEGFYLYEEVFDDENVYLQLQGFQFEVSTSREFSGNGVPIVTVKLPVAWAEKLGIMSVPKNGHL
jgi:hypothetical protein